MAETITKPDYLYLRAWNYMMGSHSHWNEASLAKARKDKAPVDSVYNDHGTSDGGEWHTFSQVVNPETRRIIEDWVAERNR